MRIPEKSRKGARLGPIGRFIRDDRAQDLIEYALLVGCVALATIAALNALEGTLLDRYTTWETGNQNLWIMPAP